MGAISSVFATSSLVIGRVVMKDSPTTMSSRSTSNGLVVCQEIQDDTTNQDVVSLLDSSPEEDQRKPSAIGPSQGLYGALKVNRWP